MQGEKTVSFPVLDSFICEHVYPLILLNIPKILFILENLILFVTMLCFAKKSVAFIIILYKETVMKISNK